MIINRRNRYIAKIALLLIFMLMLNGCKANPVEEGKDELTNVKVIEAKALTLKTSVEYAGDMKPVEEVNISPATAGKVISVNVKVGQQVKQGDILFTLDSKAAQAQYEQTLASLKGANASYQKTSDSGLADYILQAETQVKQAQIRYNDAKKQYEENKKNPARSQLVLQAESTRKQAQLSYDDAKRNYDKSQTLYQAGAISKNDLENVKKALDNANINLNTAKNNLDILKDKQANDDKLSFDNAAVNLSNAKEALNILKSRSGPQSVQVAQAQVALAEAGVNSALVQLENGSVVSPISGVVSVCNVKEGEFASPSSIAVTVINTSSFITEIGVTDKMIDKVSKGQTLPIKIDAAGDKSFVGVIDTISPSADLTSHTYTVKVKIENKNNYIMPGMFTRVLFPAEQKDNIMALPNQVIKMESNVQYIYKVVNGAVKKVLVETGLSNESYTEIKKNLNPGDLIITEGQTFLNDGEKVNVIK